MESHMPVLYSSLSCPYGMAVRLAFFGSNLPFEEMEHGLDNSPLIVTTAPRTWIKLSNGVVIDNKYEIIKFALGLSDPDKWLDCKNPERWVSTVDRLFMECYRIYMNPHVHYGQDWRQPAEYFLIFIESALEENGFYLDACGHWTVKDAIALPMVYKLSIMDETWWQKQDFPKTKKWLAGFMVSDMFQVLVRS